MINVYLDDIRPCPSGFVAARSAEECLLLLNEYEVDVLSLDYELGYGQLNGSSVVRGMIASGRYPRRIYMHSSSPSGRELMNRLLREAAPRGVLIHNRPMPDSVLEEAAKAAAKDSMKKKEAEKRLADDGRYT